MPIRREKHDVRVWIDGAQRQDARVKYVHRSIGARRPDQATVEIDPSGHRKTILQNATLSRLWLHERLEIEIRKQNVGQLGGPWVKIHDGFIRDVAVRNDGSQESTVLLSTNSGYLWGDDGSIRTRIEYAPGIPNGDPNFVIQNVAETTLPLTFNPDVQGEIIANRHWAEVGNINGRPRPIFREPLAIERTVNLRQDNVQGIARRWNMQDIASYLSWHMARNPGLNIFIPLPGQQIARLSADRGLVRNLTIPYGLSVLEFLDNFLTPFGYGFFIEYRPGAGSQPELRYFKKDDPAAAPYDLRLQQRGETFDFDRSEVLSFDFGINMVSRSSSSFVVRQDLDRLEVTWDLVPAWDSQLDSTNPRDIDEAAILGNPALARVWRDFVLDESGEVAAAGHIRLDQNNNPIRPTDVKAVLGAAIAFNRRRRFLPNITVDDDEAPAANTGRGIYVEVYDARSSEWKSPQELGIGTVQVLTDECGIRFRGSGDKPPDWIYRHFQQFGWDDTKVRVTAVVEGDVQSQVTSGANTLLSTTKVLLSNRQGYFRNQVVKRFGAGASRFTALLNSGTKTAKEQNDTAAAIALADELRDRWRGASAAGAVMLNHLTPTDNNNESLLGRPIRIIGPGPDGRQLNLNVAAPQDPPAYPIVTAIDYLIEEQQTRLTLEYGA